MRTVTMQIGKAYAEHAGNYRAPCPQSPCRACKGLSFDKHMKSPCRSPCLIGLPHDKHEVTLSINKDLADPARNSRALFT